jgi:LuxR family transcriptional regulator, maltose regulon positive regulatory protein
MADADPTSRDRSSSQRQDDLLATKFTLPRSREVLLARSRLTQLLDEGVARPVTLVCTPAGFGKSTLLGEWANQASQSVAWLSLDPADSGPVRFWRYVIRAVDRVSVGLGERVGPSLVAPLLSSQAVVTTLINELQSLDNEIVLVLDDYHVIESSPVHEAMSFLLTHLPAQLRVVIASRSDPPLPLARLRARDELSELRAAEIRFTTEETTAFLHEVWGLDLAPETVAALERRTEGWAAGLQLAALSLRERPDPAAFVDSFSGEHHFVLDYLSEEVLDRQPERVRSFLVETSILDRLTGPLCDALTGRSDGQVVLEELDRANLFLIPLDDLRHWYRFHHLFRDLLQSRLLREREDRVAELHRRAATWCEEHGLIDESIRHALASGDTDRAADLVEANLDETVRLMETATLDRWLSSLPDEAVSSRPRLGLAHAMLEWHRYRLDEVGRLLDRVDHALERHPNPQGLEARTEGGIVADPRAAVALLRAQVEGVRGDADRETAFARSAMGHIAEDERGPHSWARWLLVAAELHRGRMEQAESGFAAMLAEARAADDTSPFLRSCYALGAVQRARGKLGAALSTFREGLEDAAGVGRSAPFHECAAHTGIAHVLYARNELDEALEHATAAAATGRQVADLFVRAISLDALAWIQLALGKPALATASMDEAYSLIPSIPVTRAVFPSAAWRARLLIALGRGREAARWTEERGLTDEDDLSYRQERDHLVLARVLLARHEPTRALTLLDRLEALARSQGREESVIEICVVRALGSTAADRHEDALITVSDALSLASREGYVRVFVDEGPQMAKLLQRLARTLHRELPTALSKDGRDHLNTVVLAFRTSDHGAPAGATLGGIEPLTPRELDVLHLVAAGKRNQEIAGELVITIDTVKRHVSHIFDKLGATNRTEAVLHARDLDLIS